jgi:GntR family transcriptional regulator
MLGQVTTLKQRIAADLRTQIDDGTLPGGAALPTLDALMGCYGVSRWTAREAVDILAGEGLVEGWRPKRVRVRNPITLRVSAEETVTFIEDMVRGGHVVDPPEITVKLEGDTLVREVRRRVDRKWHNWARWEFPLAVAEGTRLAYREDVEQGTIAYLKEGLGWTVTQEKPYYDFRAPTPEERRLLEVPGWVIVEHRAGSLEHPAMEGPFRFSAVRILDAAPTRLAP